jgi:hypothetical protein
MDLNGTKLLLVSADNINLLGGDTKVSQKSDEGNGLEIALFKQQ